MPAKSLITFSPGQGLIPEGGGNESTATLNATESPVYDFGLVRTSGASQLGLDSPSISSTVSNAATLTNPISHVGGDPTIPTGATPKPAIIPASPGRDPIFKTQQLWEGTVTEVNNGGFVAVLRDKTNSANPDEQVVFDNVEIAPDDYGLVRPGSSFYWTIGTETTFAGQVRNISTVQFRRVPRWSESKLARSAERAKRVRKLFVDGA